MTNRAVMQQALECIERLNMRGFILADFEDEVESAINALREALTQPEQEPVEQYAKLAQHCAMLEHKMALIEQEPSQWRDMVVVTLVREGIDKHRARKLADHFAAQPEQKPMHPELRKMWEDYFDKCFRTQPAQEPVAVDQATMELAESVGLIGPASRTHDLHAAIQRFHDLICVNATIKAAKMAADAIRESTPPAAPVTCKWHQAPVKTSWGHEMVVADLAIDKDHTVSIYCERDQTAKVEAMFNPPAAQRPWQGLTDEELQFYIKKHSKLVNAGYDKATDTNLVAKTFDSTGFYKEVSTVLKERNT